MTQKWNSRAFLCVYVLLGPQCKEYNHFYNFLPEAFGGIFSFLPLTGILMQIIELMGSFFVCLKYLIEIMKEEIKVLGTEEIVFEHQKKATWRPIWFSDCSFYVAR